MSTTETTLMQRALLEMDVGTVIPNADISAFAAASFTAARFFQNTNLSTDYLQIKNAGLVRAGAATAADFYRPAGTLVNSSGVVSQVGPSWADTTVGSEELEIWYYGVRRDQEVLKALNRVSEFEFVTAFYAISHLSGVDGDMALSTDTNWTDVGTTSTSAKATTAAVTPWGPRSYHTVNNAVANSGTRSASVRIATSRLVNAFTIATSEVGTSSLQIYDNTNSAVSGTAVTSSERRAQLLAQFNVAVPATCKLCSLNLTNTSSTGDTYWDQSWLYVYDNLICPLPATVVEGFMAPRIVRGIPRYSTGSNVYDAGSFDFEPLIEGVDYWLVINHGDAQPYKVRFRDSSLYDWPLFIEARIPLSDLTTFSAETDTTTGPLHALLPRFKKELLETVYNTGGRRPADWNVLHALAVEQMAKAEKARPIISITTAEPFWTPLMSVY